MREMLAGLIVAEAELCICAVARLEILYSARSEADYTQLEDLLDAYRPLRMNTETFDAAQTAQREFATLGGQHRVSIPDLLIAACAQLLGAGVLHVDRHFDTIAQVRDCRPQRMTTGDGSDGEP